MGRPVAPSTARLGNDNPIYRLGDHLGIRLPRILWAVDQVDKELRWLGHLAPHLPTPVPLAKGEPGRGYPFPWLVYPWLPGASLSEATVGSWRDVVRDVGAFVVALERAPAEVFVAPSEYYEDGSEPRAWAAGVSAEHLHRLWYVWSPPLAGFNPSYAALRADGWRPVTTLRATGCSATLLVHA